MLHSYRVWSTAGVALLWTTAQVTAAPVDPVRLDPVRYDEEIVVTATTQATPRKEIPARSEVIVADEIAARQAVDVSTILASIPGVIVAQSGSPGKATSVFLRGAESDQVLVMWNGVRLNDPFFGGFDWAHLTTDGLARAEVVYGPSGVLYGSDGIGGVVNLVTQRDRATSAVLEVGTDGYGRASASSAWEQGDSSIEGTLFWRTDDGAGNGGSQTNDDYRVAGGNLSASWSLNPGSELAAMVRITDHDLGIPTTSGFPSPNRRQTGTAWQVAVPWDWTQSSWNGQVMVTAHRSELEFRDPDAFFSSSNTEVERLQLRSTVRRSGPSGHLALGVESFDDIADNRSNFGVALDSVERGQWAAFAEGAYLLGDRTRIELGARYDDDEFFGAHSTVRGGLQVQWNPQWASHARFAEGFRAPSLGELFFPFFGNLDLEPESGETVEFGVRRAGDHWTLEVARFDSDFEKLIDSDPITFLAVNRSDARSEGWEGSWVLRAETYGARVSWTDLETQDANGNPLLRRPETSSSAGITRYGERWTWDGSLRHVGSRPDLDPATFTTVTNAAYTTANLAAARDFGWGSIRARVENAFDRQYQQVLGFDSLGRRWVLGLAWK